jgi:hypothetical protein
MCIMYIHEEPQTSSHCHSLAAATPHPTTHYHPLLATSKLQSEAAHATTKRGCQRTKFAGLGWNQGEQQHSFGHQHHTGYPQLMYYIASGGVKFDLENLSTDFRTFHWLWPSYFGATAALICYMLVETTIGSLPVRMQSNSFLHNNAPFLLYDVSLTIASYPLQ